MATPRTLKHGDLYVYEGDDRPVLNLSGPGSPVGFVDNSGNAVFYTLLAGDLYRWTGSDPVSIDSFGSLPSANLNETHAIVHPVFLQDGSNTHMWFGYDSAGGSAYTVYYAVSTDGGATWGTRQEVIALGTGGSWNDAAMWPIGAYKDASASRYYIFCMGYDGANYKIGRFEVNTAGDLTDSLAYSAYGSNPVFPANSTTMSQYATLVYHETKYLLFAQDSSTATDVYCASSEDGITWSPDSADGPRCFAGGPSGALDDGYVRPSGSMSRNGYLYLWYEGQDGSNIRQFLAVGVEPDRLSKIGNIQHDPSSATRSRVYYCTGDLTYGETEKAHHYPDRGGPGCAMDSVMQPFTGSFTFALQAIGTSGLSANSDSPSLYGQLMLGNPVINKGYESGDVKTCHIVYIIDDDSGTPESFFWFPRCVVSMNISEGADASTSQASFTCFGDRRPYMGAY